MPRFSRSTWCAKWSASRLEISGERTGLVTTRYISLPRKPLVDGSTLLGKSAIEISPSLTLLRNAEVFVSYFSPCGELSFGNSGLLRQLLPQRDFILHALGRLLGRAALRKSAEPAQLFIDIRERDDAPELLVETIDNWLGDAVGRTNADPRDHLEARRDRFGDRRNVLQQRPALRTRNRQRAEIAALNIAQHDSAGRHDGVHVASEQAGDRGGVATKRNM